MATTDDYNEAHLQGRPWEEELMYGNFRRWHVIFLCIGASISVVALFCWLFRCRVPRTKQEIEADFIRRQLAAKFRRELDVLKHSEMDEMDLFQALERLREELREDTASIAQSDAFSALSFSPMGGTPTYRKGSEINLGLSLEDLHLESLNTNPTTPSLRIRVAQLFSTTFQKLKRFTYRTDDGDQYGH